MRVSKSHVTNTHLRRRKKEEISIGRWRLILVRHQQHVCLYGNRLSRGTATVSSLSSLVVSSVSLMEGSTNAGSEILSQLQTNIGYFELRTTPTAPDGWLKWDTDDWVSPSNNWLASASKGRLHIPMKSDVHKTPTKKYVKSPHRTALHSRLRPDTDLVTDQDYAASGRTLGYLYKRNFTFGMASPQSPRDGEEWSAGVDPALGWVPKKLEEYLPGTDGGDLTAIACAVKFFPQNDIFKADFSGLCYRGSNPLTGRGTSNFDTPQISSAMGAREG